MSVFLLQGIIPTEFKRVKTNDILVEGAHIDEFNGIYSLSPIPTANFNDPNVRNHDKNYLHTTNSGYRFFFSYHWAWVLANNVPSPVDARWEYSSHADSFYQIVPTSDSDGIAVFPPDPSIPGHLVFYAKEGLYTAVIPHSPGRVEVIRSRNTRFNGVYDEEGMYNGQIYYRRGDSSYGIIFADKVIYNLEDPYGPWDMNNWSIVDDLPPAPFTQYYFMQTYDTPATNGWYINDSYQNWETLYDGYWSSHGDADTLSLTITEIDLG